MMKNRTLRMQCSPTATEELLAVVPQKEEGSLKKEAGLVDFLSCISSSLLRMTPQSLRANLTMYVHLACYTISGIKSY